MTSITVSDSWGALSQSIRRWQIWITDLSDGQTKNKWVRIDKPSPFPEGWDWEYTIIQDRATLFTDSREAAVWRDTVEDWYQTTYADTSDIAVTVHEVVDDDD